MKQRDIRESALYGEAEALYRQLRQPGTGQISDAAEAHVAPDGSRVVFTATIVHVLEGDLPTCIGLLDLKSGQTRIMTFGRGSDRSPQFSPDGRHIAFLSDRHQPGDFQLYLLDPVSGAARGTLSVPGWVEYLRWSPDGKRILLGVAGHGADIAGAQGAVTSKQAPAPIPCWAPSVETADETFRWRRVWVYDLDSNRVRQVSADNANIWEAAWCGNGSIAAVMSPGPSEGLWYSARVHLIDSETGKSREVYSPLDQIGGPAASPSGEHLVIIDAVCSDRWIVAGDLVLLETATGKASKLDTHGVDVTYAEWRSANAILIAGHRDFETVIGVYRRDTGAFEETWASDDVSTGGFYVSASGIGESGDCVVVGESFTRAPEIGVIARGEYRTAKSFDVGFAQVAGIISSVDRISWRAPDGLEIQGWLLQPKGAGPHPLIMNVHGGPVWQWHPIALTRRSINLLMLLKRGYAFFFPNPRGSTGRGREFARRVVGDMGGADTHDYLSGIDHLIVRGIAEPSQLGVMGGSYGGFMTSWLVTQDTRFAAAVSMAPVSNQVSGHLVSNIPHFASMFLADHYTNPTGKYFERSPIMHAHKAKTPTLNICGALDRCTPAEEAVQFHNALLENGVESVLVTYPEEGHGVRKLPAAFDFAARVVGWFEQHMPVKKSAR